VNQTEACGIGQGHPKGGAYGLRPLERRGRDHMEEAMQHIHRISRGRPVQAQFESVIQIIGIISSLLALLEDLASTLGIQIPQKNEP